MSRSRRTTAVLACAASVTALAAVFPSMATADTTDETPPLPFDLVESAGDYQVGFHIASPWNSVSASWNLTTDSESAVVYEMAVDGVWQRTVETPDPPATTLSKRVDVPEGAHTITVTAVDASGNRQTANQVLTVYVDKYTPTFTSFPVLMMHTGSVSLTAVPMRYTWTAEDVGTGLARIRVGYGPSCCFDVPVTATHANLKVATYSDRNWRVVLYDGVGRMERVNRQAWIHPLPGSDLQRKGNWKNAHLPGAIENDEFVSTDRGDSLSFRVKGRSVSWVSTKGPKRGVADVYVDGRLKATVDLKAATLTPARSVWVHKLPLGESHRVEIVNRSSAGRSAVSVDTILVQD